MVTSDGQSSQSSFHVCGLSHITVQADECPGMLLSTAGQSLFFCVPVWSFDLRRGTVNRRNRPDAFNHCHNNWFWFKKFGGKMWNLMFEVFEDYQSQVLQHLQDTFLSEAVEALKWWIVTLKIHHFVYKTRLIGRRTSPAVKKRTKILHGGCVTRWPSHTVQGL